MNNNMKLLMEKIQKYNHTELSIIKLQEVLFPEIAIVHNCFLIDNEGNMNEDEINYEFVKRMFGNKTAYELSCNETCLNYYVKSDDNLHVAQFGIVVMNAWKYRLKSEYPNDRFCIIMDVSDKHTILRFHSIREEEGMLVGNDLEHNNESCILVEVI